VSSYSSTSCSSFPVREYGVDVLDPGGRPAAGPEPPASRTRSAEPRARVRRRVGARAARRERSRAARPRRSRSTAITMPAEARPRVRNPSANDATTATTSQNAVARALGKVRQPGVRDRPARPGRRGDGGDHETTANEPPGGRELACELRRALDRRVTAELGHGRAERVDARPRDRRRSPLTEAGRRAQLGGERLRRAEGGDRAVPSPTALDERGLHLCEEVGALVLGQDRRARRGRRRGRPRSPPRSLRPSSMRSPPSRSPTEPRTLARIRSAGTRLVELAAGRGR